MPYATVLFRHQYTTKHRNKVGGKPNSALTCWAKRPVSTRLHARSTELSGLHSLNN